jgi:hypothetical protein
VLPLALPKAQQQAAAFQVQDVEVLVLVALLPEVLPPEAQA